MFSINTLQKHGFASVVLDYVRFMAALAVVFGHGVSRFYGPFNEVANPSLSEKIFRALFSGYGSPAVMVFFVLSGLFIGQSVILQLNKQKFCLSKYFARRIVRLWIVLIPALILTYTIDYVGISFFSNDGIYNPNTIFGSINYESLSISVLFYNLIFVQTIYAPPLGTNGALWSLSNEFWYYVAFPLLIFPFTNLIKLKVKILVIILLVSLLIFVGSGISMLFPIWLLGVGLLFIPFHKFSNKNYKSILIAGTMIFVSVLLFVRLSSQLDSKFIERLICALGFFVFCSGLLISDRGISTTYKHQKLSSELAGFSYTLYLIHTPIICLARAVIVDSDDYMRFNYLNLTIFLSVVFIILVASYGIAKLTEFHTHKLYTYLRI